VAGRVNARPSPEARFATLAEALLEDPGLSSGRMFGADGLKAGGKVFAMLVKGHLVLKLPGQRVEALVAAGVGERFDPGHGRILKEWIAIEPESGQDWLSLATEAKDFVAEG